jgi:hypothetical protein
MFNFIVGLAALIFILDRFFPEPPDEGRHS